MTDLMPWLDACRDHVDTFLADAFTDAWPPEFAKPVRYPLFTGGKRVRPALAIAAYQAIASDPDDLSGVLPAATAVELIHTYSLVHDDLPALDNDDERRGRPTVHRAFDEATAILVGDTLLTQAFAMLAAAPLSAQVRIDLVADLAKASGHLGMIGGQAADIGLGGPVTDETTLTRLHALKTGALLQVCAVMGARVADATPSQAQVLSTYGAAVGLAFQLADDVLDADEDAGEDGPPSYVKLLGLDETRRRAAELAQRAIDAARSLPRGDTLVSLARYIIERDV